MEKFILSCICLVLMLAVGLPSLHAHGGPQPEPEEQTAAPEENIYAVEAEKPATPDGAPPFSRAELGTAGTGGTEMQHDGHPAEKPAETRMDHGKHQVKLATHAWVSSAQKGYGAATAITALAALAFGALSFIGRIR